MATSKAPSPANTSYIHARQRQRQPAGVARAPQETHICPKDSPLQWTPTETMEPMRIPSNDSCPK
eukprot:8711717-Pyramimonas_sp.AAC.1